MTSDDLTKSQANKIRNDLFPGVNYLLRLKQHMEKQGFMPGDPLANLVDEAYDACLRLSNKVHYMSCGKDGPADRRE